MGSNHRPRKTACAVLHALPTELLAHGGTGSSRRFDLRRSRCSALSYSPVMFAKQRQGAEHPPKLRTLPRHKTNRRRLATPRHIRLTDEAVCHTSALELGGDRKQLELTGDGEDDGVRCWGEITGRCLAGGVHNLGGQESEWEVPSDDDVVRQRSGRLTVNATRTWSITNARLGAASRR